MLNTHEIEWETRHPLAGVRLTLTGQVQGIGVRPAIARFAQQCALQGRVWNSDAGVEILLEGNADCLQRFQRDLLTALPNAAVVTSLQSRAAQPSGIANFRIEAGASSQEVVAPLAAEVPADVVVCEHCLKEVQSKSNRRHDYAFTSCADCGPRYSVIRQMPYEREQTCMDAFSMCESCRREYEASTDRRFHAQTNACPDCGPRLWMHDSAGRVMAEGGDAIQCGSQTLAAGQIVALRGLGGYQLLVDATCDDAVRRLRNRKRRLAKPLAVMVGSLDAAEKIGHLTEQERALLSRRAGPIVIVHLRSDADVAPSVAMNSHQATTKTIGLMLPTTPLHWLLFRSSRRPLVCTSGNLEGDPIAVDVDGAADQLSAIADVWLQHDREIQHRVDDSVARVMAGRAVTIRAARGYAPLRLELETDAPLVGLGAHQKSAIAITNGRQAILGPHIGDLDSLAVRDRYVQHFHELNDLYRMRDQRLVADLHPDYFTTHWAESQHQKFERVQHHHAHIAAGMLEHGWLDREVLGVAFDGTGIGTDGTIWGGEFLLASATRFVRVGHLRPFALIGAERAIREPWRVAVALVRDAVGEEQASRLKFQSGDATSLFPLLRRSTLAPRTSSAGRLFDAVAALALGREDCQYEGQAAAMLEAACDPTEPAHYEFAIQQRSPLQLDWRPMIRQLLIDRSAGVAPGVMAMRFHRGLAGGIAGICRQYDTLPVVFGGGVFQNRMLVELLTSSLTPTGQRFGFPGIIPPNDGGIAAGQLAVAAFRGREKSAITCA